MIFFVLFLLLGLTYGAPQWPAFGFGFGFGTAPDKPEMVSTATFIEYFTLTECSHLELGRIKLYAVLLSFLLYKINHVV